MPTLSGSTEGVRLGRSVQTYAGLTVAVVRVACIEY